MKRPAFVLSLCVLLFISKESSAQFGKLKEKIKQKVDQRIDAKTDKAIDKTLDDAEKSVEGKTDDQTETDEKAATTPGKSTSVGLKSYSKYDFTPGDKILYAEDFSQDVIGEFPLNWNTNGNGELVTLQGIPGKWMNLDESTSYQSPFKTKLPDNFTIEFDVLVEFKDDQFVPWLKMNFSSDKLPGHALGGKAEIMLAPNNGNAQSKDGLYFESYTVSGDRHITAAKKLHSIFWDNNHKKSPVHVAIWVQKQRIRVWLNQEKLYDLPQGLAPNVPWNQLGFEMTSYGGDRDNYRFLLSNLKIAAAMPDTRSKLITEGKWSTTGILFDVSSDRIKPVSYGVLKDIAATLKENPDVKVKILGHTDSDGDDKTNMDLSKRRAAAVKTALTTDFGIDASRIVTDGMGETKPVADNKTAEGKAQNRRVEFIKL